MRRRTEDDMSLRTALRELPQRDPPEAAWGKIQAKLDELPPMRSKRRLRPPLAIAASLVFAAAAAVLLYTATIQDQPQLAVTGIEPGRDATDDQPGDLAALVEESARLERTLYALPRFDGVVRVGTASTIAGLEDHIAWIDAELSASEALDADPGYRQVLWQERVEIMNALIDVQYAQLPAFVLLQ